MRPGIAPRGFTWVWIAGALLTLGFTGSAALETGFLEDQLVIESAGGRHHFHVEIAQAPAQWERGLMFRDRLEPDRGMLFVYPQSRLVRMWMKNTLVPLDMLFLTRDGRIARIARNAVPLSTEIIDSGGPVKGVLEINGGLAEALGLAVGDRVLHPFFRTGGGAGE